MAEVKPPRPRNVLVAEFPGLSKDDASQALRDAGGDLNKARKLVKKRRGEDVSDSDDDVVIGDTIASDAALARQLQAELNGQGPKRSRDAQDLTADSDDEPAAKKAKAPPWQGKRGTARMFAEMSALRKWKGLPRVFDIEMVQDRADKWRFSVNGFDNDCSAGRNLNSDLRKLRGQSCIRMEITFPSDYPTRPFFLRCVSPRFCWYTGHVTAGGAICIEALTTEGTPGSWQPDICVESVLNTVFMNFLDTTSEIIRTATGPGGRSGPLRVDLGGKIPSFAPPGVFRGRGAVRVQPDAGPPPGERLVSKCVHTILAYNELAIRVARKRLLRVVDGLQAAVDLFVEALDIFN